MWFYVMKRELQAKNLKKIKLTIEVLALILIQRP